MVKWRRTVLLTYMTSLCLDTAQSHDASSQPSGEGMFNPLSTGQMSWRRTTFVTRAVALSQRSVRWPTVGLAVGIRRGRSAVILSANPAQL